MTNWYGTEFLAQQHLADLRREAQPRSTRRRSTGLRTLAGALVVRRRRPAPAVCPGVTVAPSIPVV